MKRLLIVVGILFFSQPIFADVYHYIDESGKRVYVDRESEIPKQFRGQTVIYKDRARSMDVKTETVTPDADDAIVTKEDAKNKINQLETYMSKLETRVNINGNSVLVPVKLFYGNRHASLQLLLDTGASTTVVHHDAVASLNVDARPAGDARIVGGALIETHSVNFNRVEIGPYTLQNVVTSLIENTDKNTKYDGLLGMNFLRSVKYDVDFEGGVIIWEPDNYRRAQSDIERLESFIEEIDNTESSVVSVAE